MLSAAVVAVTALGLILVSWQWRRAEAKAAAAATASNAAQASRLVAFEKQAELTFHQAMALCEQGEVGRGMLWLGRGLELAAEARSERLDRVLRINLADWAGQLSRPRRLPKMRHPGPIVSLAFRREGRALVSVGADGVARTWDTAIGKEVERHASRCDRDGDAPWWDATTDRRLGAGDAPCRHRRGKRTWALSLDGRTLVTVGLDRRVRRWDAATRTPLGPEWHLDTPVTTIALTPDGRRVITGCRAGRLRVWDAATGRAFDLPPQGTEVTCLAVSPDGRVFATGTEGGVIRLWDTSLLGQVGPTHKLAGAVNALAFDPDGRVLAIGGDDGRIRLFELPHPKALGVPLRVDHPVQTLTFGKDGGRLLIGTTEGTRWWDWTRPMVRESDEGRDDRSDDAPSNRVEATAVSPDGRTLAIARTEAAEGRSRGRVELRDAATGKSLRQAPDQPHAISGAAYSPDSKRLLTWGPVPGSARLWDAATLRDSRPVFRSLESAIHQAVFSPDGRRLLLGCRDGKARLWDVGRDVEIDPEHGPRHAYPITAVAFDAGRSRLVTGCHAGTVRFWDAARGTMLNELRQNAGEIVVLAFSPDGRMLVTASHDGTARFVDADSGAQLGPALHHTDAVLCVAFDPDGQSVVTGTRDGMVQRWSVPSAPRTGGATDVRRWVAEQTGMELDELGAVLMRTVCD
jgi:WD40 repeat protein